ncbi:MAG: serine hydroxymethyltransferase [Clostridia bacterium]|nr:serine hydroxymethyltransferase [Clostridia bacterium]MEE1278224.1 serine hydroxymethyltransferase [Acutalibacteraceae bacterium]
MASKVFEIIEREEKRQATNVELIASENFVSEDIMRAVGSCLTNKYTEGYPGNRYYGGCENFDELENYCRDKWKEVFSTDYHVNVQPHAGSQANYAGYMSVIKAGDTVLAMNLDNGGHLTHGSSVNFSGKLFNMNFYNVDDNGFIDYEDMKKKLYECKPRVLLAGASAYSRIIKFDLIREMIDEYNKTAEEICYMMVDMAHIAGLVAGGVHPTPFGYADIITTTTHKTLRGPRGGMIFCKPELARKVDSAIFPGSQGGSLMHVIAGKAIAAEEAASPEFKAYAAKVVANTKAMCDRFIELGYSIVTGGTDNHLFLIDLSKTFPEITGKMVQEKLDEFGITTNKNCVPNEKRSPKETSGLRLGCAAMTTKGWEASQFVECADRIDKIIRTELCK